MILYKITPVLAWLFRLIKKDAHEVVSAGVSVELSIMRTLMSAFRSNSQLHPTFGSYQKHS